MGRAEHTAHRPGGRGILPLWESLPARRVRCSGGFGDGKGAMPWLRSGTILQATIPDGRQVKVGGRSLGMPSPLVASPLSTAGIPPQVRNRKKGMVP